MIVVDTGLLVAAYNAADTNHTRARDFFQQHSGPYVISPLVLAEADYMVGKYGSSRAKVALLTALSGSPFAVGGFDQDFLVACLEILDLPANQGIGLTDASLLAFAHELGVREIATFDHRHFGAARLPDGSRPVVLP